MDGKTRIGEIRGVAENQNIEPHLEEVLEEKLKEFPDRKDYEKRINDSKNLTRIYEKYEQKIELNVDELKFIYETEGKISRFGYRIDPRITIIKDSRNIIDDYSKMYNVSKDEIATSQRQYLDNSSKYKILIGDLNLPKVTNAEGQLPIITGDLDLSGLKKTEGLKLPQNIDEDLDLRSLKSASGLILPKSIGRSLDLSGLTSAKELKLPQNISWNLYLSSLTSAKDLKLPQTINGNLLLNSLTSTEGLKLPQNIDEDLDLNSLTSVKDLDLSQTTIGGDLNLSDLTSVEGLKMPQNKGGNLNLYHLTSSIGLTFPQSIGRDLILGRLTSDGNLDLSQTTIGHCLDLRGLTNAEGLELLEGFDLNRLYCKPEVKEQLLARKHQR